MRLRKKHRIVASPVTIAQIQVAVFNPLIHRRAEVILVNPGSLIDFKRECDNFRTVETPGISYEGFLTESIQIFGVPLMTLAGVPDGEAWIIVDPPPPPMPKIPELRASFATRIKRWLIR